jgi:hypothetical protein
VGKSNVRRVEMSDVWPSLKIFPKEAEEVTAPVQTEYWDVVVGRRRVV